MIEKLFMQTWKNQKIPENWKYSRPSIEKYMKFWKYRLMTDDDNLRFVEKYFPDFYSTFIDFKYDIMRADAIRYLWLYIFGGIYMDMDFYLNKDLSELIDENKKLVFVQYNSVHGKKYTNSLMMSEKNHPFWLMVIDEMKIPKEWKFLKSQEVYETTGPYFLTEIIEKYINKYGDEDIQILNFDEIVSGENCFDETKYIQAVEGRSWHGPLEKCGVYIHQNWVTILILILLAICLYWIYF